MPFRPVPHSKFLQPSQTSKRLERSAGSNLIDKAQPKGEPLMKHDKVGKGAAAHCDCIRRAILGRAHGPLV